MRICTCRFCLILGKIEGMGDEKGQYVYLTDCGKVDIIKNDRFSVVFTDFAVSETSAELK